MHLIPSIDLINGRCVRLTKGDFTIYKEYSDHPIDVVKDFLEQGATCVQLTDLDGARSGSPQQTEVITEVLSRFPNQVQVGGGLRTAEDAALLLEKGASQLIIGSVAVRNPELLLEWAGDHGADRFIVAVDLVEGQLATQGWKRVDATKEIDTIVSEYVSNGILNFQCTDINRDGMLQGPNIDLYRKYISKFPNARWTASGGVAQIEDLLALKSIGLHAVIVGTALYEGRFTLQQAMKAIED